MVTSCRPHESETSIKFSGSGMDFGALLLVLFYKAPPDLEALDVMKLL